MRPRLALSDFIILNHMDFASEAHATVSTEADNIETSPIKRKGKNKLTMFKKIKIPLRLFYVFDINNSMS